MPIQYDMPLYRPPSEGNNLIIQATLGCSANYCTFCSMYKSKSYMARPIEDVFADIDVAATEWPSVDRVFLADGDALVLPMDDLKTVLNRLDEALPNLTRVSAYATPKNLIDKTVGELTELKQCKLSLVYMGIETGSTTVLKRVIKGASQKTHAMALDRARDAGLKVSATVILGLAGQRDWQQHIAETAALINEHPPTYLSTLQLTLEDAVVDEFLAKQGDGFQFQSDEGILDEQEHLIELLSPTKPVIFRSNHASNCLALAGNLPKDRDRLLSYISVARSQSELLRPRYMRGL